MVPLLGGNGASNNKKSQEWNQHAHQDAGVHLGQGMLGLMVKVIKWSYTGVRVTSLLFMTQAVGIIIVVVAIPQGIRMPLGFSCKDNGEASTLF
eukprot:scaffold26761_cov26-Tisochrysis_lutea.AAC.1